MRRVKPLAGAVVLLGLARLTVADDRVELLGEIARLQRHVASLEEQLRRRDEALTSIGRDLRSIGDEVAALKEKVASPLSGPFLAGPPPSSDSVGIAKVAVFAPKVEVDASRRHDIVFLKVKRIEAGGIRAVGDTELGSDQTSVSLPLDQNGALYVVDWSTSEGHSYNLVLRDGASEQAAATVQVKPLQGQGRFILVGYRVE